MGQTRVAARVDIMMLRVVADVRMVRDDEVGSEAGVQGRPDAAP
ncbi:hypothetical protein Q427_04270 [Halomonas sp. BC04]|nr:hypothetical protein Q427_04270 [Halomonas sp. BC04]